MKAISPSCNIRRCFFPTTHVSYVCLLQDARFNEDIDIQTGYKTRSILSMPIKDASGEVLGVAQAVNKLSLKDEPFDEHDEKVVLLTLVAV